MSRIEDQLRESLRREDPPPGFAERVISLAQQRRPSWRERFLASLRVPQLAFATVAVAVLVVGGVQYERHQQEVKAERAKERVMLAMRITGAKLNYVQQKVQALHNDGAASTEN